MAGDWLKIEVALPEKPEVWQIAGLTGLDPDLIVGKLFKVWRWFDAHTESGNAKHVTYALVDSITGVTGFAEAMVFAGWLEQVGETLRLPNFDKHNGNTAKSRADTAKRVASHRIRKATGPAERGCVPAATARMIRARDSSTCRYCKRPEGVYSPPEVARDARMHIDHVVPLSRGGADDPTNMVCACEACNKLKSNRTPDECGMEWPKDESGNRIGVTSALPREEKRREENKEQKQEPVRSPSGSRLSADWSLPDEWRSWAERERPDVDVLRESRVFADYWAGQAGAKGRKADWQATWRNWIRRADARPRGSPDAPSKSLSAIQRLQSMKIPENGNDPELASERDFGWPQQARLPPAR